jgi:hypothetical protein
MLQSKEHSHPTPERGAVMEIVAAYWRDVEAYLAAAERGDAAKAGVLVGRWDAAVAALAKLTPSNLREAAAMQAIALDCCDRGEWTDFENGHVESANILRRVGESMKLWSEAGAPLLA